MISVVIYARYSCDNQREESIEGQLRECRDFCKKHNFCVVNEYIDRALSARADNRPQFKKMINDSQYKTFEKVIVWKLDRFARNRNDSIIYKMKLLKNGVKVVSATEHISDSPEGIILESVLEGFAEYYSKDLSQKVTRGMKENFLKGKFNGGIPAYGFKVVNNKLVIDENEQKIVKRLFEIYTTTDLSLNKIATIFNEEGLRNRQGKKFTQHQMNSLISNRKFIGELSFKGETISNALPISTDLKTFELAQQKKQTNKINSSHFRNEDKYILSGKLYCGECNHKMIEKSVNKSNGKTYRYYKCQVIKNRLKDFKCDNKPIKKDFIEHLVFDKVWDLITDSSYLEKLANKILEYLSSRNPLIPQLIATLTDINKKINNLLKAIEDGAPYKIVKEKLDKLATEKDEISNRLEIEKTTIKTLTYEQIIYALSKKPPFKDGEKDLSFKEQCINQIVNKVIIYKDGRICIIFNYKNGNEPYNFNLNSSSLKSLGSPLIYISKSNAFLMF